jgi:ABC-type transport system involved in multi-copper enzyme maturation permease subunit
MIRGELLKLTTTKLLWILSGSALAWVCLNVVLLVYLVPGASGAFDIDPLLDEAYLGSIIATAGSATAFILVLGIIGMTSEYRHMTITSTFLAQPHRGRVVGAKALTFAIVGAVLGIASVVTSTVLLFLLLLGQEHADIPVSRVVTVLLGVMLGMALYAIVGVAVGALIKNQIAATVLALLWVFLAEPLLSFALPAWGKWMPGGALNAAMDVRFDGQFQQTDLLPVWGGALLLLAYAAVLSAVALATTTRRDIT